MSKLVLAMAEEIMQIAIDDDTLPITMLLKPAAEVGEKYVAPLQEALSDLVVASKNYSEAVREAAKLLLINPKSQDPLWMVVCNHDT